MQLATADESKGASPQAEDGHIDIANETAEALAQIQLSGNEWRILWVIFRKTNGWHKKMDRISVTQFQKATNLKRRHASRALSRLVERNIVSKNGDSVITTYGFQKDYTKWKTVTKNDTTPKTVTKIGAYKRNYKRNKYWPVQKEGGMKNISVSALKFARFRRSSFIRMVF